MQQDPNLQAPFNPNGQPGYQYPPNSQGGYPQQPMYPQFNNTYNNNGGFQQNPAPGYNPAYNPPGYQQPYAGAPQTQVVIDNTNMQVMTAQNSAYSIESRILTGYCCYTCLVYFELICSIGNLIWGIVAESALEDSGFDVSGFIALYVAGAVAMFIACIVALVAKANFSTGKQRAAFFLFMIATCLVLAANIVLIVNVADALNDCYYDYYGNWVCGNDNYYDDDSYLADAVLTAYEIGAITGLVIQFLINLTLIISSYSLVGLMRRREEFLREAQNKAANGGGAAVVITA